MRFRGHHLMLDLFALAKTRRSPSRATDDRSKVWRCSQAAKAAPVIPRDVSTIHYLPYGSPRLRDRTARKIVP